MVRYLLENTDGDIPGVSPLYMEGGAKDRENGEGSDDRESGDDLAEREGGRRRRGRRREGEGK